MKKITASNPALILIDIQKGFDNLPYWGGARNNPNAEQQAKKLLEFWRDKQLPIFHVQHCSSKPTSILHESNPGNEHKEEVKPLPGEPVIKKNVNSAFIGTDLQLRLTRENIHTVIIFGLTTDHCVSTTTRMAGNMGYETYVVSDASAAFAKKGIHEELYDAETIHLVALAHLKEEFATVVTADELIESFNNK